MSGKIKTGRITVPKLSTDRQLFTVHFDAPFKNAPIIMLEPVGGFPHAHGFECVENSNVSSFSVYVQNTEISNTYSYAINWVAVEP